MAQELSAIVEEAGPEHVLVVYNVAWVEDQNQNDIQDSLELALYYAEKRSIPEANILGIDAPLDEIITRAQFDENYDLDKKYSAHIRQQIEDYLVDSDLKYTIRYIVLVKGVPLKISNFGPGVKTVADGSSVDAAISLLFNDDVYDGTDRYIRGYYGNPYFIESDDYVPEKLPLHMRKTCSRIML
jgi:uncharacterized protein (TIGR03790 family)